MKLYLAFKNTDVTLDGEFEKVLGVFDTKEKAWEYLKTTSHYEESEPVKNHKTGEVYEHLRAYYYDGTMTLYWTVEEVELNKPRCEYE